MKLFTLVLCLMLCLPALASGETAPYLRDRGPGVPTSMFGTYILPGEFMFYPFFEYYINHDAEYSPQELGHGLDEDFRSEFEGTETLLFLGYGISENLALEAEAALYATADLDKSVDDPTDVPEEITESGLGDVQMQLDWRWLRETSSRPAFFSYTEIVFPFQKDKLLIGTSDWEFKFGTGMIRGFGFGTMTLRAAWEYDRSEEVFELGEVALEYLRRLSPTWRIYAGVEGTQDEWELIKEVQLHVSDRMFFKFNSAIGITSKSDDWAPETGIVFRF